MSITQPPAENEKNAGEASGVRFDRGTLVIEGIRGQNASETFPGTNLTYDKRAGVLRCDALYFNTVNQILRDVEPGWSTDAARWQALSWPKEDLHTLRSDQNEAVKSWLPDKRGIIVMPTGTGKTEVGLAIMHLLGVSTLIISPVRDLMYQWHQRILDRLGYDAGIIGDNTFNKRPVSVTTYDSASIHMQSFGDEFGLLIFDECHHLPGPVRSDAARMSIGPYRLGLTATLERSDGRENLLEGLIGPVVYRYPISRARGKVLAEYDINRIPVYLAAEEQARYDACTRAIRNYMTARRREDPDFTGIELRKEVGNNAESRRIVQAIRVKESIEDRAQEKLRVLEDLFRLHNGSRILVFTGSNAMAREVSARFLIPCLLHHSRKKERKEILDGFRSGSYPAIVANQVLDEGVDIPEAKIAIVLGGFASAKQAKQRLGRILRKTGEARAVLYEVVCAETREVQRSRQRRRSDAYQGTRHIHL